ncbi:hypothetical protein Vqi01_42440 [Micromonospora qiuiae]|uniref:Uncharacterized protein n=1 Tax=Micromonospora qiuiae TaxID=502268 RepID=A0ABQ4JHW1_9ACTN|nr:hypothetical protein [Micromonospora qiuiae]GIJ29082.1 hypothetical protein Vqi01_42440 [Micromonospora qiuiae]
MHHRNDTVQLALGAAPLVLPEPVDHLLAQLAEQRSDEPSVGGSWMFPGAVTVRPCNVEQLTRRLNRLGIRVRPARSAALRDLVCDVPAVVRP